MPGVIIVDDLQLPCFHEKLFLGRYLLTKDGIHLVAYIIMVTVYYSLFQQDNNDAEMIRGLFWCWVIVSIQTSLFWRWRRVTITGISRLLTVALVTLADTT